jgi:hypothetical protein
MVLNGGPVGLDFEPTIRAIVLYPVRPRFSRILQKQVVEKEAFKAVSNYNQKVLY